ncbi:MAG: purine-nucleoside phosphorylase [Deltaproteobacteria bacterium]|nr:purine-nucleoside phosphorylase [Deltaproteobacteria bacterium]
MAVATIRTRIGERHPTVGLVLGSGLGSFADRLVAPMVLDYSEIPHFPISTVTGHAGRLVIGDMVSPAGRRVTCMAMQGRVHFYEGHDLRRVTLPIRTMILLGAKTLIITNAAGGVNPSLSPGELVIINDHINLFPEGPLRGDNDERLGSRFPDMTRAYNPELRALALRVGKGMGLALREGVYAGLPGPSYETPAEIRMLGIMGADLCGMSTVPEVIVANHQGARVLGISCVTNMAAGLTGAPLSHEEVTETANRVRKTFEGLVEKILWELASEATHDRR